MANANYREITGPNGHLANRETFQGNSMAGHAMPDGTYIVKSYDTVIATVSPAGEVWVSDERYSVTTTRQQNACRAWLK